MTEKLNEVTGDELSVETSLSAKLDEGGIKIAAKSRAIAALDRLVGGVLGWAAAHTDGARRKAEARAAGEVALIEAEHSAAIEALKARGLLGEAASERFVEDQLRRQRNRGRVAIEAVETLKALPPPQPATKDEEAGGEEQIDPDWLNYFADHAERASSQRLQQMWGAVLAGEIRKPGEFSLTSLRVISELDQAIAVSFQEIARLRFADGLLRPENLAGKILEDWQLCEDAGLITSVTTVGGVHRSYKKNINGYSTDVTKNFYIKFTFSGSSTELDIPLVPFTRAGREIARILPWNELDALRRVSEVALPLGDFGIEIGEIADRQSEGFLAKPLDVIRPSPGNM